MCYHLRFRIIQKKDIPVIWNTNNLNREHSMWRIINYRWLSGEESTCQCRRHGLNPWVEKIPWRRKWLSTSEFLPRTSHGWRSLAGSSPWGCKELTGLNTACSTANGITHWEGLISLKNPWIADAGSSHYW